MSYRDPDLADATKRKLTSVRRSITRAATKLDKLEADLTVPEAESQLRDVSKKLDSLNEEYKTLHYKLLDLVLEEAEDEVELIEEKMADHEDKFSLLTLQVVRLSRQIAASAPRPEGERRLNLYASGKG